MKSHINEAPHLVLWMCRAQNSEDPWISYRNHFDEKCTTMLYGENSYYAETHTELMRTQNGLNVWIRQNPNSTDIVNFSSGICDKTLSTLTVPTLEDEEGTWYLVRRVAKSHNGVHPSTDYLVGTDLYGDVCAPTDDGTFSIAVS